MACFVLDTKIAINVKNTKHAQKGLVFSPGPKIPGRHPYNFPLGADLTAEIIDQAPQLLGRTGVVRLTCIASSGTFAIPDEAQLAHSTDRHSYPRAAATKALKQIDTPRARQVQRLQAA